MSETGTAVTITGGDVILSSVGEGGTGGTGDGSEIAPGTGGEGDGGYQSSELQAQYVGSGGASIEVEGPATLKPRQCRCKRCRHRRRRRSRS